MLISSQATAHDAFRALVNLSDNSFVSASLAEKSFFSFLVSYILVSATLSSLSNKILMSSAW